MTWHKLLIFLFVLAFLSEPVLGNPELRPADAAVSLRDTVLWLSEKQPIDADAILAGLYDDKFAPYRDARVPAVNHPFWLKMQFLGPASSMPLVLITNARLFDTLDVYIRDGSSGTPWQRTALGLSREKPDDVPPVPFFAVPFAPQPNATVTIYAHIDTAIPEPMEWIVSSERLAPKIYKRFSLGVDSMLGVLYALTAMYFALAFTSGYARGSLWLALMTLFSIGMVITLNQGFHERGNLHSYEIILFFAYVGSPVLYQLARSVLELPRYFPRLDRWMIYLTTSYLLALPVAFFIGVKPVLSFLTIQSMVGQTGFLTLCFVSFWKKLPSRHYYTWGMGSFWIGCSLASLSAEGLIKNTVHFEQGYVGGLVMQIFMFGLAINSRVRDLRIERERLARDADVANAESRAKSDFLAVMSHEIRTPMNGVLGMVELLRDTPLNETQRYYSEAIQSSGRTLLTVINDILDFSKIESGKLELENIPFALDQLVIELIAPYRINYGGRNIEFLADIAPQAPNDLRGDPVRLQQAIGNLLANAFKFTESGHIKLHISAGKTSASRTELTISVSDTGIGISAEEQLKLFSSFQQAATETTRKYGGTGLGLAICKRLVLAMHGSIGVESSLGKGSTFQFTVELERTELPNTVLADFNVDLTGRHFLIIDDNRRYLELFRSQMDVLGLPVDTAHSVADAMDKISERVPDLIIIDKDMPDMDGLSVASQLRGDARYSAIPLLLVTASCGLPNRETLFAAGIQVAAVKPVSLGQLKRLLQQALSDKYVALPDNGSTESEISPCQVLVAEDNVVNREVIRGLLRKLGIKPTIVEGGLDAVKEACCRHFDLVLMDYEMPDLDGCQATKRIRDFERASGRRETLIYALTAHAMAEFELRTRNAGMNGHLTKPVSLQALQDVLNLLTADTTPATRTAT